MKVKDLIEQLSLYDGDAEVYVTTVENFSYPYIEVTCDEDKDFGNDVYITGTMADPKSYKTVVIKIARDFSETPGGRYVKEGKYSAEEFRDTILITRYKEALRENATLVVDFDGCYGFAQPFLEEAFGGFVRKYHIRDSLQKIKFVSTEDERIPGIVTEFIRDAETKDLIRSFIY